MYISMYSLYDMLLYRYDAIEYKICFGYWFQTNRSVQNSGNYCLFFLFNQYPRYNMVKNQTFCKRDERCLLNPSCQKMLIPDNSDIDLFQYVVNSDILAGN